MHGSWELLIGRALYPNGSVPVASIPSEGTGNEAQARFRLGYRPALDGLRAFAVVSVMFHHAYIHVFWGGNAGVDIFFILSGFLITSLLIEEWNRTGHLSLTKFYLRRALRLLPALFALLIFVQVYSLVAIRGARFWQVEKASTAVLFYVGNWMQSLSLLDMGSLSHTWSLSIEEQFYLVWPLLLLVLLRKRLRGLSIFWIVLSTIVLLTVRRVLMWDGSPYMAGRIYYGTDTRADELLAGCATAFFLYAGVAAPNKVKAWARNIVPLAVIFLVAIIFRPVSSAVMCKYGWTGLEISVALILVFLVTSDRTPMHRLMELAPIVWVGRISYALYLWHFPILTHVGGWHALGKLAVPVGFVLTFAAASASYYFVETPFLRRKAKLEPQLSPSPAAGPTV